MSRVPDQVIRLFLCGDVMTGRGIDQVLPHPGSPVLHEPYMKDAREYVRLAEDVSGPIPSPVDLPYIWGDSLDELRQAATDLRIVNLETSITSSDLFWPGKGVYYRMHPANIGCLTAVGIHCCCLANNHVLDWGYDGLAETIRTLDEAGIAHAGAGADRRQAAAPAALEVPGKGRVLVFSVGSVTSGIPPQWAATDDRPGVDLLPDLKEETAWRLLARIEQARRPGDAVVVSIHWGSNWGNEIPESHVHFARLLAEQGVQIVHGHSSHHVRPVEVRRDRLILYGCGDFVNDYEGIAGHERFRGDLAVMYLVGVDPWQGRVVDVRLVPFVSRRFQLRRASAGDVAWLTDLLNAQTAHYHVQVQRAADGRLVLVWQ